MKIRTHFDDRIKELGFNLVENNNFGILYERYVTAYDFVQVVHIVHKASGKHIVQSYDKKTSQVCGLTFEELHLFNKKVKQIEKRWKRK